jgi:uncharacterized protein
LETSAHAKTKTPFPKSQGYVNDLAGLLSHQSVHHLERLITSINQKTTAEVAIVTLNSTEPYSIEDYAVRLYENWGIGQKGKDNGVLLLVALQERKVRIEVGYGLEGAITDGTAGAIIRQIITPAFKKGLYDQGILAGTEAILHLVAKEYNVELSQGLSSKPPQVRQKPKRSSGFVDVLIFLISLFFLFILFRSGLWPLLFFGFPFGGGGWSRGGGSFGGGFGGFGGGLSGGGGASGSW